MKKFLFVMLVIALFIAACIPSQEQIDQFMQAAPASTQDIDQIVQATFQALTAQAPTATAAPAQADAATTGGLSGRLSYPSSAIPAQLVVAFNINTSDYYWTQTAFNQSDYQLNGLPPGAYHIVAYALPDGKLAGRYDQFYLCGLAQGCDNDNWVDVQVLAGVVTPNIDPGNWYGGPEYYPPMPDYDPLQASGAGIYSAPMPALGGISGSLSYPSSFIPSMVVVAFDANGPAYYYVVTNENSSTYQIDNLPQGSYFVVAYPGNDSSYPGGYSQAVPCGLFAECSDHSLIPVTVTSDSITTGINPGDFYAPPGTFPNSPVP